MRKIKIFEVRLETKSKYQNLKLKISLFPKQKICDVEFFDSISDFKILSLRRKKKKTEHLQYLNSKKKNFDFQPPK